MSIDWNQVASWIIQALISFVFGALGAYFVFRLDKKREAEREKREKQESLRRSFLMPNGLPPANVEAAVKWAESELDAFYTSVTSDNIGIELHDGKMGVMIEQGTPLPTKFTRDFYLQETNDKKLEVIVREGSHEEAIQNKYCGEVILELPSDMPHGSAITVGLTIDSDYSMVVNVLVKDFPDSCASTHITGEDAMPQYISTNEKSEIIKPSIEP